MDIAVQRCSDEVKQTHNLFNSPLNSFALNDSQYVEIVFRRIITIS